MSEIGKNKKIAVVLFNLGGPEKLNSVRPFLYNLFSDKWIIRFPSFIRYLLAIFISIRRENIAKENYSLMGGKSPLLEETVKQKIALEEGLKNKGLQNFKVFISMRYWHPFSSEVVKDIKKYGADEIIFLPLYPQASSATTVSSFEDFENSIAKEEVNSIVKKIGCYFDEDEFILSHKNLIKEKLGKFNDGKVRILFSAHSIPVKFVNQGDPYEWQVTKTVEAIRKDEIISKHDYVLCYQSKVGRIEWLSPSTEKEIERAAKENINLLIVPIAFISEHIETLVELDIEYAKIAKDFGILYERVPALGIEKNFIDSLAKMVVKTASQEAPVICFGSLKCPSNFKNCICR